MKCLSFQLRGQLKNKIHAQLALLLCSGLLQAQSSSPCVPSVSLAISAQSICIGQSATYIVSGCVGYTYMNIPAASPSFTSTTGVVSPTTHTSYHVTGMNQYGCISDTEVVLFVNPLPTISIVASPTMVCAGFPSTLTANAAQNNTAHVYSWAHGGNSGKTVVNPFVKSTYTVYGTNTVTTCQNTQTMSVAVFNPTFNTTPDTGVCNGNSVTLSASGANSFTWSGGPKPGNGPLYLVSPTVATVYTVGATTWTVNGAIKCNSTKTISVGIYPQPTVTAFASRTITCRNVWFYMWAKGADLYYYWRELNQTGDTVWTTQSKETKYSIIGVNSFGCRDTAYILIRQSSDCWEWLGLNEPEQNKIQVSIYPNPSEGSFAIEVPESMVVKLQNATGQSVKELRLLANGIQTINTEGLAPGVYFLTGRFDNKFIREKLVIQK